MSVESNVVEGVTKPASDQPDYDAFVSYATNESRRSESVRAFKGGGRLFLAWKVIPNLASLVSIGLLSSIRPSAMLCSLANSPEMSPRTRCATQPRHERAWVGAFDKPMTKEQVLAVAKPFFAH
ncbi:hypothetical protein V1278_001795 [Bradyrhizobium sp. AZCC 1577]|uniref:hypothetical protein n=1 Tax=Bradyrhizobium sp. AZCC 1577 TaxID=3117019 RepID=UPI002FF05490